MNFANKKTQKRILIIAIIVMIMVMVGSLLKFIIEKKFSCIGCNSYNPTPDVVRSRIMDDLMSSYKKISFDKNSIIIERGKSFQLSVGIRNTKSTDLNFKMRFTPISGPNGNKFSIYNPNWFDLTDKDYKLNLNESDVKEIRLVVPRDVTSGSYALTLEVIDNDLNNLYAEEDLFITISD